MIEGDYPKPFLPVPVLVLKFLLVLVLVLKFLLLIVWNFRKRQEPT